MITSIEAREMAKTRNKSLEVISELIREAAMNGEFAVVLKYRLHKLMSDEIVKCGFKVETLEQGTIVRW